MTEKSFKNEQEIQFRNIHLLEPFMPYLKQLSSDWAKSKTPEQIKKINILFDGLTSRFLISKEKMDTGFLLTFEAQKIVERAIELATNEIDEEKFQLYNAFLKFVFNRKFSPDKNKLVALEIIEKTSPLQAWILRNATEWLILAHGRDIVRQAEEFKPADNSVPIVGFILEQVLIKINILHSNQETIAASLDNMVETGVFEFANAGQPIQIKGQTGRGFRPTKAGIFILEYMGIELEKMPELSDFKKS